MAKILIGLPTNRPIKQKTVECLLRMVAHSKDHEFLIITATLGYTPSEKRNWIIVQALNAKCDYIFFTDDDMVFPPETLETLLSRDKDVIGVLYRMRGEPPKWTIEGEIEKDVFQCKGVGAGLMLINCRILMNIQKEDGWFGTKVDAVGQTIIGDSFYFCDKVRQAGYGVWCDPTIKVGHLGEFNYE